MKSRKSRTDRRFDPVAGIVSRLAGAMVAVVLMALMTNLAIADQVVYFVNGKAMIVKSVEKGPKFTVLEVEGGGRIGVPTEQIDRIEEYQVQPAGSGLPQANPAPAALSPGIAPVPMPIVPATAPSTMLVVPGAMPGGVPGQPVAQGPLVPGAPTPNAPTVAVQTPPAAPIHPSTPLPLGQGFGGRADLNPQGNLSNLHPVFLGGDPSSQAVARPQTGPGMYQGGPGGPGGFGANRLFGPGGPGRPGYPPRGMANRLPMRGGGMGHQRSPETAAAQAAPPQGAPAQTAPPQAAPAQTAPPQPAPNPQPAATPAPPPPDESESSAEPPPASTSDDSAPSEDDPSADQGSS